MKLSNLEKAVRDANIKVFEKKDFDEYEKNPSIFEPQRQTEIAGILEATAHRGSDRLLDIGCGTGNILRLAQTRFKRCYGLDVSAKLLGELRRRAPSLLLCGGEGVHLPFRSERFDAVTLYGVLHHIVNHRAVFEEVHRILKRGGTMYIDHDPNYFFGRFYHIFYRIRYAARPGFGTHEAELSEYHHTRSGGLNPIHFKEQLQKIGFRPVEVHFRMTTNPQLGLPHKIIRRLLQFVARLYPAKSFFTHFWILATK